MQTMKANPISAAVLTLTLLTLSAQNLQAQAAASPTTSGFAQAAEGLQVHYEVYGKGEPIVMIAGGLMPIATMSQIITPLALRRQVIAIDLEGHDQTGLRDTPMSFQRNGDDVVAVLDHLGIPQADVAGYSHGADAALWTAIQHPDRVRNLIVISTAFAKKGWYPEAQQGMSGLSGAAAESMKSTPIFQGYAHPRDFSLFLDRMGDLMRQDWDWREQVDGIEAPTLLIFADHDSVQLWHIAEFFALFGGGTQEPGFADTRFSQARLAIIPGYSHYNLGQAPEVAQVIERYLTQPTSAATMFTP